MKLKTILILCGLISSGSAFANLPSVSTTVTNPGAMLNLVVGDQTELVNQQCIHDTLLNSDYVRALTMLGSKLTEIRFTYNGPSGARWVGINATYSGPDGGVGFACELK